jgi:hypothetical protein
VSISYEGVKMKHLILGTVLGVIFFVPSESSTGMEEGVSLRQVGRSVGFYFRVQLSGNTPREITQSAVEYFKNQLEYKNYTNFELSMCIKDILNQAEDCLPGESFQSLLIKALLKEVPKEQRSGIEETIKLFSDFPRAKRQAKKNPPTFLEYIE